MTTRLFVYGTLTPVGDAWPVLEPWTVGSPCADAVAGRLYDTGRGYPAATFDHDPGTDLVHGTVVTLDPARVDAALAALDRYEAEEYDRVVVRTVGGIDAYAYDWVASLAGCRPLAGGRWPA